MLLLLNSVHGRISNCSEGQIRTYEVTRGPHYGADAKMAVSEFN